MPSKILFSSILLYFLDEYRGISRDSLHSARETQLLCGGRFDGDIILIGAYHLCQTSLHGWHVGIELWALGTNSGIDVAQYISLGSYQSMVFLSNILESTFNVSAAVSGK